MRFESNGDKCGLRYVSLALLLLTMGMAGCQRSGGGGTAQFRITMPKSLRATAADGRMILVISKDSSREPRLQITNNELNTQQIFGVNVDGLAPDGTVVIDGSDLGYPLDNLADIPPGDYNVQAVLNLYETFHRSDGHVLKMAMDHWEGQKWNTKPGNLYSTARQVHVAPGETVDISLDKVLPEFPYPKDTKYVKYVRIQSKLLTAFWGRPMELGAFVVLPDGWDTHPNAHYPLVINPGHFPTGFTAFRETPPPPDLKGNALAGAEGGYKLYQDWTSGKLPRMILMNIQHANPFYDDSYGVNSANIGPYGDAITQELIPYIEQKFRGIGQPWSRMLTGCSTGGWEALGMQMFYPDFYNGEWTGAPTHIDNHSSRLLNLYTNKNAYYDEGPWGRVPIAAGGNPGPGDQTLQMPSARMEDNQLSVTMEADNHIELVVGDHGRGAGLWDAYQAVWSPVGPDGYPAMIWNKLTGEIDPTVAKYWQDHWDLTNIMQRDWATLGPKLVGKIHITSGTSDQWYLTNSVRRMEKVLEATKNPYYAGTVEYGDRFVHCWQGDPTEPEAISTRTVYQRQMPVMLQRMLKTAPAGADLKSWKY